MLRVPIPSKSCWRDWVSVSFTISPPNASVPTTCTAGGLWQGSTVMSNEPVEPGSSQWSPEHWLLVTHNWDELASCCSDSHVSFALGVGDGIRSEVDVRVVVGCVVWGHCALLRGIVVSGMIVTGAAPNTATVTCRYKQVHIVILWADQYRCSDWLTLIEIESSFGDCCMLMLRAPIPSKSCWRDWVSVSFTISPPNGPLPTTCTAGGLWHGSTEISNEPNPVTQFTPVHWSLVVQIPEVAANCSSAWQVGFNTGVGVGYSSEPGQMAILKSKFGHHNVVLNSLLKGASASVYNYASERISSNQLKVS